MGKVVDVVGRLLLNRSLVGAFVLLVVLSTLALDIAGLVHPCPYCRIQRLALGVLALIMLTKFYDALICRYITLVVGMMGLVVGIMQNFNHVKKINKGEFDWSAVWIGHPWILSGLAILALCWQIILIFDIDKYSRK